LILTRRTTKLEIRTKHLNGCYSLLIPTVYNQASYKIGLFGYSLFISTLLSLGKQYDL